MKMIFFSLFSVFILTACSTNRGMRGGVVMKINEREAHVCLGNGEVKEGDQVVAYYNDCQDASAGGANTVGSYGIPCVKKKLGKGVVTKILNDHYSVVQFDEGVKFTERTFVEKQ